MTKVKKAVEIRGVNVFIKKGNKFLTVKRSEKDKIFGGMWVLPGGKIEKGETVKETAKREIYEETGLSLISMENNSCMKSRLHIKGYPSILLSIHRGKVSNETPRPLDEDIEKVEWIDKMNFINSLKSSNYPKKEIKKLENFFSLEGLK